MLPAFIDEAAEIIEGGRPLLFTCEHASRRVPAPLEVAPTDVPILQTHWGWDIGAGDLTRALCRRLDAWAVLARFSRLVCDANREVDDPTWIRGDVEGKRVGFNRRVNGEERRRRLQSFHMPYHSSIDTALGLMGPDTVLIAIHSFTPRFIHEVRDMKVGVLYDAYEDRAKTLRGHIAEDIQETVLNQPYSGFDGLMYSATRHGRGHGIVYLELEVRQDLIDTPRGVDFIADRLASALVRTELVGP